jgi:RND family efflux transporter MFP subunit
MGAWRFRRRGTVWCTAAVCGALALAAGCGGNRNSSSESMEQVQQREGVPVRVSAAVPTSLRAVETAGATVRGYYQAELSSGVPGRIKAIDVKVGQRVKRGAVLVRIDPDVPSPIAMAKANYEVAEKSRDRVRQLAQEGGVSKEVVENVEAGYTAAEESYRAARRSQNILAPFAGKIIAVNRSVNEVIGPGGRPVVEIAALDSIRTTLSINETLIDRFGVGQKAYVRSGGDTLWGVVKKVSLSGSEESHSFDVECVFPNPGERLKPGVFVTVYVVVVALDSVLSVPYEIVLRDAEGAYVYVVDGGNARRALLELGLRAEGRYEVKEGLAEGRLVVTEGASRLADGVKVKAVE